MEKCTVTLDCCIKPHVEIERVVGDHLCGGFISWFYELMVPERTNIYFER